MEVAKVAQRGLGVRVHVCDLVALGDDALGIDQVAVALGEAHLVSARCSSLVCHSDLLRDVGKQPVREVELVAERPVRFGRVERDAEDLAAQPLELLGLITQALALNRSAGSVGHRVPPQQHPSAAQIREPHRISIVVYDRVELGRRHPGGQHPRDCNAREASSGVCSDEAVETDGARVDRIHFGATRTDVSVSVIGHSFARSRVIETTQGSARRTSQFPNESLPGSCELSGHHESRAKGCGCAERVGGGRRRL